MWYRTCLLTAIAIACGCGDTDAPAPDLSVMPVDMVTVDLATPSDLLPPPRCSSPVAQLYSEVATYIWSSPGGPPAQATTFSNVGVGTDGVFTRTGDPVTSPDRFACTFTETDIDPLTCTAPCCPATARQPQPLAPTVYVDSKGWSSWTNGSCVFSVGSTTYSANVLHIGAQGAH